MKKNRRITGCIAFFGILTLIFDSKTALEGAKAGVNLCLQTVIPSLFPFLLLSVLLTGTLSGSSLPLLRPIANFLGIPKGTESVLLTGFLGGYPTGAQSVALAHQAGLLTKSQGDRLLSFCSNAGPAFLFGMAAPLFSHPGVGFLLWGIHIASALLVAVLLPAEKDSQKPASCGTPVVSVNVMHTAMTAMATVCGWVILFRVVLTILDRWFLQFLPVTLQVVAHGILELTNGCCALTSIPDSGLRFLLCSGMLSWGGICVVLQTSSVTAGLSIPAYIKGKLLQTLFSLVLSAAVVLHIWFPVVALLLLLVLFLQKTQKRGSNPTAVGV